MNGQTGYKYPRNCLPSLSLTRTHLFRMRSLRIAFTIFPDAMSLDFIGPLDILNTLSRDEPSRPSEIPFVECVIVGDKLEPIKMSNGMQVTPAITYDEASNQHWDAVLVPGGQGARPWYETNQRCREFLVQQVPKCTYVFTGKLSVKYRVATDETSLYWVVVVVSDRGAERRKGDVQQASLQVCSSKSELSCNPPELTGRNKHRTLVSCGSRKRGQIQRPDRPM